MPGPHPPPGVVGGQGGILPAKFPHQKAQVGAAVPDVRVGVIEQIGAGGPLLPLFLPSVLLGCLALIFLGFGQFYRAAYPLGYQEAVEREAAQNGLEPALRTSYSPSLFWSSSTARRRAEVSPMLRIMWSARFS